MTFEDDAGAAFDPPPNRAAWTVRQPCGSARCSRCGSAEVANIRTFATGSGSVFRTLDDDVYCRRCGMMGQPCYEIAEEERRRPSAEPARKSGRHSGQAR